MSERTDRRLLVLDDEPLIGMLVEAVARLEGWPARVTEAHGAFFEALVAWQPTHIVLDLTMPGMDGEQVLHELGRLGCRARIIISSGADAPRLAAASAGAAASGLDLVGVLPKPFTPQALRALLAQPAG
jgi:CheY-like chemotaxis protein